LLIILGGNGMLVIGNTLIVVGQILGSLIWVVNIVIIAAVIMSWVSADPRNPLVQFVKNATDPMFAWVRRYVKPIGMIDLSPLVILLILQLVQGMVVNSLIEYGQHMKMLP
jgi:YggT family protein